MKKMLGILAVGLVIGLAVALLSWAHHVFVIGLNPFMPWLILLLFLLLVVPLVIKGWGWARRQWLANEKYMPAILFLWGCMAWLISGVFIGDSGGTVDFMLHDTYFVIANLHIVFGVPVLLGLMAATYFIFSDALGSGALRVMSLVHFLITLIGVYLFFWPDIHFVRQDEPRRYMDYSRWMENYDDRYRIVILVWVVVLAQLMYMGMVGYAAVRRLFLKR